MAKPPVRLKLTRAAIMTDQTTIIVAPRPAAVASEPKANATWKMLSQQRWIIGIASLLVVGWCLSRHSSDAAEPPTVEMPAVEMPAGLDEARGMIEQQFGRMGERDPMADVDDTQTRGRQDQSLNTRQDMDGTGPGQQRTRQDMQQEWEQQQALEQEWLRQQQEAERQWREFFESQW